MENLFKRLEAIRSQKPRRRSGKDPSPLALVPFVARTEELDSLLDSIRQATAGHGCFLFVSGDPGSGKSRLLAETMRRLRGKGIRGFLVQPTDHPLPFSLFGQLLRDMSKVFFAGGHPPDGIFGAAEPLVSSEGHAITESPEVVEGSLRAFLGTVSRICPVAIFIDDFPHVDHQSLNALLFLERVLRTAPERPRLAFVLTFRPDELAYFERAREVFAEVVSLDGVEMSLPRLSQSEVEQLVAASFPDLDIDTRLAPLVWEQSQGNPFFALTLLDVMKSDATLSFVGKTVQLMSDRPPELPSTLVDVVLRKLSTLTAPELRLLGLASVGGLKLDPRFLSASLNVKKEDVVKSLKGLAQQGRLLKAVGDEEFEFDPPATAALIHQELSDEARTRYHEIHARALQQLHGPSPEHAFEIASHFDAAGLPGPAAGSFLAAARFLRQSFAWSLARHSYDRYLELARSSNMETVEALLGLAECQLELGLLKEAEVPIEEAIALSEKPDLTIFRGNAIMLSAKRLFRLGDSMEALAAIELCEEIFQGTGDEGSLARALELRGEILDRSGSAEEAEIALEAALTLFTKVADRSGRCSTLLRLAAVARLTYRFDRAMEYIEQAMDSARELGDALKAAALTHQAGLICWLRGDRDKGRELIVQALSMARRLASPRGEAESMTDLAAVMGEAGDIENAVRAASEARDLWRALSERPGEARCHAILASLYAWSGPHEEARAFGLDAARVLAEVGDRRTRATVLADLARVSLATGELEAAQKLATESLGLAESMDDHGISGQALAILGVLLVERGEAKRGKELLDRALLDLKAAKADAHMPRVQAYLGRAMYLAGQRGEGLKVLEQAISEADYLGLPTAKAETLYELGRTFPPGGPEARMALEGALDVARQTGLAPMVESIEILLAASGEV